MKKIVSIFSLYLLVISGAIASSIVTLSGGGDVSPGTSLRLSLNGIVPSVIYNVVCYIDTTNPFQYILLGSSFSDTTSIVNSYSLNGNYVTQAPLNIGKNTAVINGKFTTPATGYIVFTNMDQANSFNINNCFAIPVQA